MSIGHADRCGWMWSGKEWLIVRGEKGWLIVESGEQRQWTVEGRKWRKWMGWVNLEGEEVVENMG